MNYKDNTITSIEQSTICPAYNSNLKTNLIGTVVTFLLQF